MDADLLVRMANQIAAFFAPYPTEDAIEGVRDHIIKFWDPGMRAVLLAIASGERPGTAPLDALVLQAVQRLKRDARA